MPEAIASPPDESMDSLYEAAVDQVANEPDSEAEPESGSETETPEPKSETKSESKPDDKPELSDAEKDRTELEALAEKEDPYKDDKKEPEKPVEKKEEDKPVTKMRARDLKVVYEEVKAKNKEYEAKLLDLEKKLATAEARKADDVPVLTKRLEEIQKRNEELENHIRYVDFTKSKQYQESYEKPFQDAYKRAVSEIQELTIEDENGNSRQATAEDLRRVSQLPLGEARKLATQLFGAAADDVMQHRRLLRELAEKQDKALEDARTQSLERAKQEQIDAKLKAEKLNKRWQEENQKFTAKYPKWFQSDPADESGNLLLKRGFEEVDRLFHDRTLTDEQRMDLHIRLRSKAANHDRMALRLKRANARIKELETSLGQYERSTPATGKTTGKIPQRYHDWQEELASDMQGMDEKGI